MSNKNSHKKEYKPQEIEAKWQKYWRENKTFSPDMAASPKPFYNLMMFPYPSAEGLHIGNMYAFTGADVFGRFMKMNQFDTFVPIGLDGFGIHSENYALKIGKHPLEQAKISAANFYRQLEATGNAYDWTRTLETYDPEYYRWTQWIFIQMFKMGLAYRRSATVNWCPSDKTVLADEQVIDGKCERDGAEVEKRDLEQWFFAITEYADRLLDGLDRIDWPRKIKIAQRNWIGKSEGARLKFEVVEHESALEVFTTRPDTLYGATFMVIAPEHALVDSVDSKEVAGYVKRAKSKSERERTEEGKEKTGVFTGLYAKNPVNGEHIPIWVADYVLAGYGTGAIMAVPAHDQRDYDFAKKYNLPIKEVVRRDQSSATEAAYVGPGRLVNSGEWDGIEVPGKIGKVIDWIEKKGIGVHESNYHLRDWLISRQRYWGPPIPMIYCKKCFDEGRGERGDMPGWYTAPEADLPVLLPDVIDWRPEGTGTSPLANHPEFYETKCPSCQAQARRETDVSDTFLDSAWYYLRYLSIGTESARLMPYDIDFVKRWCPVSIYIGGAEHSVLHLLYVRFLAMVLHDLDSGHNKLALPFEEPFPRFFAHGLIVKDGAKMSKSRGNVVIPDQYISKFGTDTMRLYLMFLGQFAEGGDFRDTGIEGMARFVKRVWVFLNEVSLGGEEQETTKMIHKTIKMVSEDIENFSYNTAIARLMEFYNFVRDKKQISKETASSFVKLLTPFAPHMAEEIWHSLELGKEETIHKAHWPKYDEKYLAEDTVIIPIQINGKRRGEIQLASEESSDQAGVEQKARKIALKYLEGRSIRKVIYVPGKIINFVI